MFFVLLFTLFNHCNAKIPQKDFNEVKKIFEKDMHKLQEIQNKTFFDKHKWKIVGTSAGIAVGTTIAVLTLGYGTPAGVAAGTTTSSTIYSLTGSSVGAGTAILASGTTGGIVGSSTSLFVQNIYKNDILITDELKQKIMLKINEQKNYIINHANTKEEALDIMSKLAMKIIKNNNINNKY
jgi:hypothetical protein